VDLSLLQFDVPPLHYVPSIKTSTLLLDMMDSPYDKHMAMCFAYWALLVPRCDHLIIDPATFGDIVYVPGVGGFLVDVSFYCEARHASQLLELVYSDNSRHVTMCSSGKARYFLTFFNAVSIHKSTGSIPLFFT
jgi:hypothetical protein